jgi:hypothetical protein
MSLTKVLKVDNHEPRASPNFDQQLSFPLEALSLAGRRGRRGLLHVFWLCRILPPNRAQYIPGVILHRRLNQGSLYCPKSPGAYTCGADVASIGQQILPWTLPVTSPEIMTSICVRRPVPVEYDAHRRGPMDKVNPRTSFEVLVTAGVFGCELRPRGRALEAELLRTSVPRVGSIVPSCSALTPPVRR